MTTFNTLLNNLHTAYKSDNYRKIQKALKACRDTECSFDTGHYDIWLLLTNTKFTSKKNVLKALCKKVLRKEADRRRARREYHGYSNQKKQEYRQAKQTSSTEQQVTWVTYYNEFINGTPKDAKRAYRRYQMKHYSAACQGDQRSKELMQIINKARDEYQKEMDYRAKHQAA